MSVRPLLLDLFCGAGGAAMGYARAGFEVIGVDLVPQPNYPFKFYEGDALVGGKWLLENFPVAAVHASPPCQRFSSMSMCRKGLADSYPDMVDETRQMFVTSGMPYVIENVPNAPLVDPIVLCGTMFGRELYRHRLFESNVPLVAPKHPKHVKPASRAGHWTPGTVMAVAGHIAPIAHARKIMDMDWTTRAELAEAIPPIYTEYVGAQLMKALGR